MEQVCARSITIRRVEGQGEECIEATLSVPADWQASEADLFGQAERLLKTWADTAPKGGCYHKCDFSVTWDDGEIYQGRYDLRHRTDEAPDLTGHIARHLRFYAGTEKPAHMTAEQYAEVLGATEKRKPGYAADYRAYLAKYRIGYDQGED